MARLAQARRIAPLVVMLALTVRGSAQVIPATGAPPGPRTAMIVGQVVDNATGDPVPEAIVMLTMPKYFENPTTPRGRVMADGEGRFFFTDLPPGEYFLQATREGYAPGMYGQRRAWGQNILLSLGEGERPTDITIEMWKHGVIAGTVVDEAGEPVAGVAVRAVMKDVFAGRPRYGNMQVASELVPTATTDDRGMFRLSQLMPGTYVVLVPSNQTTLPASFLGAPDPALRSDLFFAGVGEMSLLGQPRTQQVGDSALLTLNRVLIPPPPSPAGRMSVYPTTYFPAAATAGTATQIALAAGEERTDITISVRPVPAVRVSGRLVTPDGSVPPPTTIRLVGAAMTDVITTGLVSGPDHVGFETVTGMSDATGRFTLLGVPAGEYVLTHANRFLSRAIQQGQPAYWVSQAVAVGADDLLDLVVMLRPALRVAGRVEYRGDASTPPHQFSGILFETPFGEPGQFFGEVTRGATPTFSTVAAGGQYIARPYETSSWFLQSVTLGGKDITDRAFDLQADATSLVVTYTDRPYVFTGVAPGAYTVKATIGSGSGRGGTPIPNTPTQWAAADVMVNGQDLEVPLTLQPGVAINGRVVFEGSQPTAAELQALSFALVPPGAGGQIQASGGGRVDAEGRFTFAGVIPDTYRFVTTWNVPAARDKWAIRASTANGREAFEAPLRVNANETVDWTVTYTDKPTSLSGVFQDRGGRAATEYYILLFSSDRKHWTPGSRRIRMTRPATDGAFSVKGLPPGEYFLAALADLETGEWNDPTLLEELVKSSARVTLRDGEETKQDFRVGG